MEQIFKKHGFTLIETIVFIAIFSIIILAIISFFIWALNSNVKINSMQEVLASHRRAMEIMTQEIKEARDIYTPTSSSTQLSLITSKYTQTKESISYLDFFLCGTRLCLKKETLDPQAITSDTVRVSNIHFVHISTSTTPAVQIYLEISYKNDYNRPELQAVMAATSTASLRSY